MPGVLPKSSFRQSSQTKQTRRGLPVILILGGAILGVYWFLFASPTFSIQTVEVEGLPSEAVTPLRNELMGKNIFRINSVSLTDDARQLIPSIKDVTVARGLPHTVRLKIGLRDPAVRWVTRTTEYVLDHEGVAFAEGKSDAYAGLPAIRDDSGLSYKIGQTVATDQFVAFMTTAHQKVAEIVKRNVATYEVKETTFHFSIILEGEVRILMTVQRPYDEQLQSAARILAVHPEAKLIDVRVPGRGYWR
jgi:cell division septal protein FtsQ